MTIHNADTEPTSAYDYPVESRESSTAAAGATSWSTVLASAGIAAVVAALILTIGFVGLFASDRGKASDRAQPTMVNLGAQQPRQNLAGTPAMPIAPEQVSEAPADAPLGAPTPLPPAPADAPAPLAPALTADTAPDAGQLTPTQTPPLPANFRVTAANPTLTDLGNIVRFLVETPASDQAKAANVEGGMAAVVVPRTVYTLGLFRAPLGWNRVTGPLNQSGNSVTATLNSGSAGRPTIRMTIEFKKIDGNWRLAASSLCRGVQTVGLKIYCNA